MKPTLVKEEKDTAIEIMCIDVFGEGWGEFKIAHLSTGDGIGIEIFEFPQNNKSKHEFNHILLVFSIFQLKDPNIEELTKKIVEAGGKQRMPIREYYPGKKPYKMVYCEDPFGNIIEIYTHSYELHYGSGSY